MVKRVSVLFVGHGSPMNAIADNDATRAMSEFGADLEARAVLAVSAHWLTEGVWVQDADPQPTLHDFSGFPNPLSTLRYPAKGSRWLREELKQLLNPLPRLEEKRGLDHGVWTVLRHMFPKIDVPVLQLSMPRSLSYKQYFELGRQLRSLRDQGVLILASGNLVHNLQRIMGSDSAEPFPWAVEFDAQITSLIRNRDLSSIFALKEKSETLFRLAHPSDEHFLPLLYALGASYEDESLSFPHQSIQNASISMRSVRFG